MADSPLTLAEVTGFMTMEVKLQSSLTEQNAKFIKVYAFDKFVDLTSRGLPQVKLKTE